MFKLENQTFLLTKNGRLRFMSASTAAAVADATINPYFHQQNCTNPYTQVQPPPESYFSQKLEPKVCISWLLKCRNKLQIRQVHAHVAVNGLLQNLIVANKLLYIYVQHKALGDAYSLFGGMRKRNPVSNSVMVGGFAKVGDYMTCFGTFREIIRCGVWLDNYTMPSVITACWDIIDLQMGRLIHVIALKYNLELDHFVCAALVDMYAKCMAILYNVPCSKT